MCSATSSFRLLAGIQPATLIEVVAPMETVLSILALAIIAIPFVIVQGSQTWEMEDPRYPPYVLKPVREVHHKEPTPLPTKDLAVTVDKKPEKTAVPDDLDKPKPVIGVMVKKVFYCFEDQSVDDARRIMREHDLQYLLVLDRNMRIVGMVRMRDLGDEDHPQSA